MAELRRASWLRRGYAVRQVDAAVAAVEAALGQDPPDATAHEVRRVAFSLRHHGYEIADVDALMDGLERRCVEAELRASPPWQVADRAVRALDALREGLGTRDTARFPRTFRLRRGYDTAQVDALLTRALDDLEGLRRGVPGTDLVPPAGMAPEEVRDTVFRRRRHGYREEAVDRAFDEVIDLLLRRDVVRERLTGGTDRSRAEDVTAAPPQAEGPSRRLG